MKTFRFKVLMKEDRFISYTMTRLSEVEIPRLLPSSMTLPMVIENAEFQVYVGLLGMNVVEELKKCKLVEVELRIDDSELKREMVTDK